MTRGIHRSDEGLVAVLLATHLRQEIELAIEVEQ
jgi:hypothetical protein